MLSISNEFQRLPDEMKLFSLYVNRYFPKKGKEKEFKNCEEPQIINEKEQKKMNIANLANPLFLAMIPIGIVYYTIATGLQFSIGSIFYVPSIGIHAIANLGGLTNLCRHSKYIYTYSHSYIISNKIYLLDKELPEEHISSFATPYVYYKIMKSINEFNHLSENNKLLIVKYVKENRVYNYQDIKNNDEIEKLYTRIFFNYKPYQNFLDSLFYCDMENIKHSTIESLFISNYMKFLIGNHISIISE